MRTPLKREKNFSEKGLQCETEKKDSRGRKLSHHLYLEGPGKKNDSLRKKKGMKLQ